VDVWGHEGGVDILGDSGIVFGRVSLEYDFAELCMGVGNVVCYVKYAVYYGYDSFCGTGRACVEIESSYKIQ
jgi:hypothetical protein